MTPQIIIKMSNLSYRHPLIHNGTHQKDRVAKELLPENLRIDERGTKDFLQFAHQYAELLKYFNENNIEEGNWQCFFSGGILGILSIVTSIDLEAIDEKYCRAELDFWESLEAASEEEKDQVRKDKYQALLNCIYDLAKQIHKMCGDLPNELGLKKEVLAFIKSDIGNALLGNKRQNLFNKLIAWDKANQLQTAETVDTPLLHKYNDFILSASNNNNCVKAWGIGNIDAFFCILPDDDFKEQQPPDQCKENRKIRTVFAAFFRLLSKIVKRAEYYLKKELDNNHAQEPQVSLFISFVFLFRRLIDQYNQLTERHLDFYYQQVLCLPFNTFQPDKVFVFFELAKNYNEFQLKKGTLLDAKKDKGGNNLSYEVQDELVVNKAKVEACQALYLNAKEKPEGGFCFDDLRRINTNQEGGIKNTSINWRDFHDDNLDSLPKGNIGFAFSDPILNMTEGIRFIVFYLELADELSIDNDSDLTNDVQVFLSSDVADDGWMAVDEGILVNLNGLDIPDPSLGQGLSENIGYTINNDNVAVTENKYSNISGASSYAAKYIHADKVIRVSVLIKEDNFPINIPETGDVFFVQLQSPALKVVFNNSLCNLFNTEGVINYRVVTESVGVEKSVKIRNKLGTYTHKDTFPLLGLSPRKGDFIEFDIEELKGKQIMGLEPNPKYGGDPDFGVTPQPNTLLSNRFTPRFKLIDRAFTYPAIDAEDAEEEMPQLPGNDNFKVVLKSVLELPTPRIQERFIIPSLSASAVNIGTIPLLGPSGFPFTGSTVISQNSTQTTPVFNPVITTYYSPVWFLNTVVMPVNQVFTNTAIPANAIRHIYSASRNENILTLNYDKDITLDSEFIKPAETVKGVAFRYSAFANFYYVPDSVEGQDVYEKKEFERFYITPLGYNKINQTNPNIKVPIFPEQYLLLNNNLATNSIAHLEIGVRDLTPGQELSLLFQMEEGSGNPNFDPPEVVWSFLAKDPDGIADVWLPFNTGAVYSDSTKTDPNAKHSLLQTGIVRMITDPRMTNLGTSIKPGSGLYWIRASFIEKRGDDTLVDDALIIALPTITAIHTQATTATFINNNNTLQHLESGLPVQTIGKLLNQVPAIKNTNQPLASFGGRLPEDRNAYYRRISERLRHKNRAINIWDYERLILEAFPEVAHAKAISHTDKLCEASPGKVMIVVFPDLKNRVDINPFIPRFGIGKLEAIEDFLRERANLFLYCNENIQVVNPEYELIQVKCCVRFRQGYSPTFYRNVLNNALNTFLAPWATDAAVDLHFSSELYTSVILNFIEEQEYVDVVSEFQICQYVLDPISLNPTSVVLDSDSNPAAVAVDLLLTNSARSLFTTFPSGHDIKIWGEEGCDKCRAESFTSFEVCPE